MSYPCYDHQLGCYLESYSDRVRAEKKLGVYALQKGEEIKRKQPKKIDMKRLVWESMQRMKHNPKIIYEAKIKAKKEKYELMLKDYELGKYTFKTPQETV
jgi:hypothetical protein